MSNSHNKLQSDLATPVKIGEGQYGIAYQCVYIGADPDIKGFANNGNVVLKEAKEVEPELRALAVNAVQHESTIMAHLRRPESGATNIPKSATIIDQGKVKIVCEMISYSINPKDHTPLCANLEQLLRTARQSLNKNDPKILGMDATVAMNGFIHSIFNTQDQLHGAGVIHLDSACRNFMVTPDMMLKIIDFGLSEMLHTSQNGHFPIREFNKKNLPVTIMDQDALNDRMSIKTDLFARRMAMIESMSILLGADLPAAYNLKRTDLSAKEVDILEWGYRTNQLTKSSNPQQPLNISEIGFVRALSKDKDDQYILNRCVDSLAEMASKQQNVLGAKMTTLIESYSDYLRNLTVIPDNQYTPENIMRLRNADRALFTDCAAKLALAVTPSVSNPAVSTSAIPPGMSQGYAPQSINAIPFTQGYAPQSASPKTQGYAPQAANSATSSSSFIQNTLSQQPKTAGYAAGPSRSREDLGAVRNLALIADLIRLKCADKQKIDVVVAMQKALRDGNSNALKTIISLARDELNDYQPKFKSNDARDNPGFRQLLRDIVSNDTEKLQKQVNAAKENVSPSNEATSRATAKINLITRPKR